MEIDDNTLSNCCGSTMNWCSYANGWTKSATWKLHLALYTPRRRPDAHSDRSGQEQITLMQWWCSFTKDISSRAVRCRFICWPGLVQWGKCF